MWAYMSKLQYIFIIGLLLLIAGCTPAQQDKARELLGQHRCQAYNGYLCSAPDDCGLSYLDTIESYCCPIKCQTCNQTCNDNNDCTEDSCSKQTNFSCVFTKKQGACQNDGICSETEVRCNGISTSQPPQIDRVTALNSDGTCRSYSGSSGGAVAVEEIGTDINGCIIPNQLKGKSNKDCPISCDDGDDSTSDWYDTHSNQCENTPLCNDGDANTIDWFDLDSNGCEHCPKQIAELPQNQTLCPNFDTTNCTSNGTYVWNITSLNPVEIEINTTPIPLINETELYIRRNNITSSLESLFPDLATGYRTTIVYPIEDVTLDFNGFEYGKIAAVYIPDANADEFRGYYQYTLYKFKTIYDANRWYNLTCENNPTFSNNGWNCWSIFRSAPIDGGLGIEQGIRIGHLKNVGYRVDMNRTSRADIYLPRKTVALVNIISNAPTEII